METSASNATVSSMSKGIMCILISTKRSLTPGSVHNSQLLTVACWRKKFFIQFLERMKRKNLSPWSPSISYAHAIPEQKNIHKYFMNTSFIEMMQLVMRLLTLLCIYCASILWRMVSGAFCCCCCSLSECQQCWSWCILNHNSIIAFEYSRANDIQMRSLINPIQIAVDCVEA